MQIYMQFAREAQCVRRAPTCPWVQASIALDLMALGPREGGVCSIGMLGVGLARAAAELADGQPWPRFVRTAGERGALRQYVALLSEAREKARAEGADRFVWREDF